jgi:hypothetical protein
MCLLTSAHKNLIGAAVGKCFVLWISSNRYRSALLRVFPHIPHTRPEAMSRPSWQPQPAPTIRRFSRLSVADEGSSQGTIAMHRFQTAQQPTTFAHLRSQPSTIATDVAPLPSIPPAASGISSSYRPSSRMSMYAVNQAASSTPNPASTISKAPSSRPGTGSLATHRQNPSGQIRVALTYSRHGVSTSSSPDTHSFSQITNPGTSSFTSSVGQHSVHSTNQRLSQYAEPNYAQSRDSVTSESDSLSVSSHADKPHGLSKQNPSDRRGSIPMLVPLGTPTHASTHAHLQSNTDAQGSTHMLASHSIDSGSAATSQSRQRDAQTRIASRSYVNMYCVVKCRMIISV